ncbi:hypothetical protein ABN028_19715 [Actinopolymorpha sp. B17G11]|uniref:hypothetical protein n=1 Tax=Actinopolymorpha sp. B17G11 TaxID=3160861 RepID=UPI0032E3775E
MSAPAGLDQALHSGRRESAVAYNDDGWLCLDCDLSGTALAAPLAKVGAIEHVRRKHRRQTLELRPVAVDGAKDEAVTG